jgi:hypothetical protein
MKMRGFTVPEVMLIGGTRAALGAGIAFLLSGRLNTDQRKTAGWVLFAVGVLTSVPLAMSVFGKQPVSEEPLELMIL